MVLYNKNFNGKSYQKICREYLDKLKEKDPDNIKLFRKNSVFRNIQEAEKNDEIDDNLKAVCRELAKNEFKLLERIISALPSELEEITNNEIENLYEKHSICINGKFQNNYKEQIKSIMGYEEFDDTITREWFFKELDIPICSYCNINKVTTTILSKNKPRDLFLFQIDHFMRQSEYPLFTMSFYNLVVSCSICNEDLKKNSFLPSTHIHPYVESFHQFAKFDFAPNPAMFNPKMKIKVVPRSGLNNCKSIQNTKDLQYNNLYREYEEDITRLMKAYIDGYKPNSLHLMFNLSSEKGVKLFKNKKDLNRFKQGFAIPKNEDEIKRMVLGKLKFDFFNELQISEIAQRRGCLNSIALKFVR